MFVGMAVRHSIARPLKIGRHTHCVAYVAHTQSCMPGTRSEFNDSQTIHKQGQFTLGMNVDGIGVISDSICMYMYTYSET